MKCERIQRLISEGYERRLTLEERLDIREHIQTCAACAAFERNLRTGLDAIHRLPDITPSRKLWESVHTLTAVQPRTSPKRIAHQALGIAGAALTVALVAVFTIVLINHNGGTTEPPSTTTARQGFGPQSSAAAVVPSASSAAMSAMSGKNTPEASPITPTATATPKSIAAPEPTATPGITYVSPTPVVLDDKKAEDTVVGYFHAINQKDYAQAYAYLGDAMQQTQSYESFAAGFSETEKDTVTITDISPSTADPDQLAVTLHLDADQIDGTTRKYDGTWFVGIEGNVPKIVSASVAEEASAAITPTPVPNNLCRSPLTKVTASYSAVGTSIAGSIIVTYSGERSTCVLEGVPQIEIVDANGTVLKTAQVALNPGIVPKPLVLENNQQAELRFIWSNWCAAVSTSATPTANGDDLWFRVTLAPGDTPITLQVTDENGQPLTATPQCINKKHDSTISVQGFARYPDS
jgi:hypothetical protein